MDRIHTITKADEAAHQKAIAAYRQQQQQEAPLVDGGQGREPMNAEGQSTFLIITGVIIVGLVFLAGYAVGQWS